MNFQVRIPLNARGPQQQRLFDLQRAFAAVCNDLAPKVQQTRCWNRVALHHMAYKDLRQKFPDLGSQLVCNAIYSVSRSCRAIYQHPSSPFNLGRLQGRALPLLHFLPQSPVYFDRHTLSIKNGQVSMFTLDGRLKFELDLQPEDERRFRDEKLREIVLTSAGGEHALTFTFAQGEGAEESEASSESGALELPDYVVVTADDLPPYMPTERAATSASLP